MICSFTNLGAGPVLEAEDTSGNKTVTTCSPGAEVWEKYTVIISGELKCEKETQGRVQLEGEEAASRMAG